MPRLLLGAVAAAALAAPRPRPAGPPSERMAGLYGRRPIPDPARLRASEEYRAALREHLAPWR